MSGILHDTGGISSRFAALVLLLLCTISVPVSASPLFEDDSVLDIHLKGPLGTIYRDRKSDDRIEHPFILSIDGQDIPVDVRLRGKSRVVVCRFPPLRLSFSKDTAAGTVFAGQNKLKLVTHCRNDSNKFQNYVLNEYTAYRIFNLLSDIGYRVRLLRIQYEDTDAKHKHLDRPYYGFLIESAGGLATRTGAAVANIGGAPYSRLDDEQTARVFLFQYLIANFDWSLVTATDSVNCCHNISLIESDSDLYPIPYDFDRSGLVNASYVRVPGNLRIRRATQRLYLGYCKTPIYSLSQALDEFLALRDDIMAVVRNSPVAGDVDTESRVRFIEEFLDLADSDREGLLEEFDKSCIGPR